MGAGCWESASQPACPHASRFDFFCATVRRVFGTTTYRVCSLVAEVELLALYIKDQ